MNQNIWLSQSHSDQFIDFPKYFNRVSLLKPGTQNIFVLNEIVLLVIFQCRGL